MRSLTAIVMMSLLAACTYSVPRKYLPYPVSNDSFADPAKTVIIPLPLIASSPNEGITTGVLSAVLIHNADDEVSTLIVPQLNFNDNFGITTSLYGAFYPSQTRSIKISLSKATRINEEYRIRYRDEKFLLDTWELNATAFDYADGSARFFGFQSNSSTQNETNYTDEEAGLGVSAGYRFCDHYQLVLGDRYKRVNILRGAVTGVPFISDVFSATSVPGSTGFQAHGQRLSLVFSTLDSSDIPTSGLYANLSIDNNLRPLGSSADYQNYGAEVKFFDPIGGARYLSVFRFACNQTVGDRVPFLEQSILGGETTLRGYGQNRFIDKSYMLLNLEERIRLFRWEVFNVKADWEVAPFIDLGSVMKNLAKAKPTSFEFNPGLGIRAVVRPNLVGRIDVGVGRDGPAVFAGLGYPF